MFTFGRGFALSLASLTVAQSPVSFVLIGDSTTAPYGGWGDGFCGNASIPLAAAVAEGTFCSNRGVSGATTGTYKANGHWDAALPIIANEVADGKTTYVTLQFGHNDQKIAPPESMGANLTEMVQELRALGAEPILVTSLTRRIFFENGTIDDGLKLWAEETILISEEQDTHLLDLHAESIQYVEAIGEDAAHRLNWGPTDNTHLNDDGAIVFGRMIADILEESFGSGTLPIVPNEELTYNITHGIPSF
ncbi:carbohydrate esterase family 12 protein [Cylindrobasidium torrendii FP15055 ss-10]|uniref:Carbohydrate esterase family 12 protein n=1 Tax=Cylindrobasidium torrendii FP15055 ss-10 TaxID=1314674 RepID=A0A0D7B801_9AGAR|nr:carbohydrate esterase family 12 protein [Cylindrobasidium torrendii FP15055 ss-10]